MVSTRKRLPSLIELHLNPEFERYCVRGDEGCCAVVFAIWAWAADKGVNLTHVKTFADGRVRFNAFGNTYIWPPQHDVRAAAEELDTQGTVSERVIYLRTADATITALKVRAPVVRVQKPRDWKLNKRQHTYRPAPVGTLGHFHGTMKELKDAYPGFSQHKPGGHGKVSPRRRRFQEALTVMNEGIRSNV